ncbi:MAG TPA: sigma-70 family RNA polymerase sigma factor [Verrucomicrobiae bacterium]|nr:sigma-70 family RNA polymerase sigma factor [Verrucomicrobiae bacterium]
MNDQRSNDLSIATRASLLDRLRDLEDQSSWQRFYDTYARLICGVARRVGLTEAEAEDILQETVISVAKHIPGFVYDPRVCSFRTWMLRLTRWRIINQMNKRITTHAAPRTHDEEETSPSPAATLSGGQFPEFDAIWQREWEEAALEIAIDRVKHRISPDQFQIFDLYALRGMNVVQVAAALGTNAARVYLVKHRVAGMLKQEIAALEKSGW